MSAAPKPPPKSILKQVNTTTSTTTSWFSKLNGGESITAPPISPKINSFFSSFRKQQQPPSSPQAPTVPQLPPRGGKLPSADSDKDELAVELTPKEIRRVRFPVNDLTKEYQFKRDDLVQEKKEVAAEPINIQTCSQLLSVYETLCRKKQEKTIDLLVLTLTNQPHATFLTRLDLTNQLINRHNIDPLADMMNIEFGIRELVLNNCGLEDDAVKILMHCLLNNDKMTYVSLANNPKLTSNGFKYIAVYIKGARQLCNLDLSCTQPDKKAIQYITSATTRNEKSDPSLKTLSFNNCGLRNAQIEVLASGMRKSSSIRHLYLRSNRFVNDGALAIGVMLRDYDNSSQSLEGLYLDNNDLSQGIQYIAQALRRNSSLLTLSTCDCRIDAKGCALMAEALKYNQCLERYDIGYNSICSPNLDGITQLRKALNVNRSLKDLRLAETDLGTEAAIAIAECLPENTSLVRLDLARNPRIDIAGLMALSVSIRMNHTITFLDINIPTDDKEMVGIHNRILETCTRNAQNKTKPAPPTTTHDGSNPLVTTTQATARLTLQERLAAVTQGKSNSNKVISASSSEVTLGKNSIESKKASINEDDAILTQQAFDCVGSLEDLLLVYDNTDPSEANRIISHSRQIQAVIRERIPFISDSSQLEILLAINDRLTTAIQNFDAAHPAVTTVVVEAIDIEKKKEDNTEDDTLSSSFEIGDDEDDDEDEDDNFDGSDEGRDNYLKELRSEIEAEESAAFLKAKKIEQSEAAAPAATTTATATV